MDIINNIFLNVNLNICIYITEAYDKYLFVPIFTSGGDTLTKVSTRLTMSSVTALKS